MLGLDIPDYKLEKAEVCREYTTQNGRRIDIVIRSKSKMFRLFIPIEVKIWARDINEQCKDYYEEAKKYDDDAKIFYLEILYNSCLNIRSGWLKCPLSYV